MPTVPGECPPPPQTLEEAWDYVFVEPDEEERAESVKIINEFNLEERAEVTHLLAGIEVLAKRRSPLTAEIDGIISESEFYDAVYDERPPLSGVMRDPLCVSFAATEALLGKFPSASDFPDTEAGKTAARLAIIAWTDSEKLLGRVADAVQSEFGFFPEDGTAFSVGKGCYVTRMKTPPSGSGSAAASEPAKEDAADDWSDPAVQTEILKRYDAVKDAVDDVFVIAQDLSANDELLSDEDFAYFRAAIDEAREAILASQELDPREAVHARERLNEAERLLAAAEGE